MLIGCAFPGGLCPKRIQKPPFLVRNHLEVIVVAVAPFADIQPHALVEPLTVVRLARNIDDIVGTVRENSVGNPPPSGRRLRDLELDRRKRLRLKPQLNRTIGSLFRRRFRVDRREIRHVCPRPDYPRPVGQSE